jgi:LacI family transcriptional regulator
MVRGYTVECEAAGIAVDPTLIQRTDAFDEAACHALLASPSRPTAIVAPLNDAALVLQTARELGLNVPRDLSVVSVGDHQYASLSAPALTVVTQEPRDIGREAADLMLQLLDGTVPPGIRRSRHPMRMIIRESCAAPPAAAATPGRRRARSVQPG